MKYIKMYENLKLYKGYYVICKEHVSYINKKTKMFIDNNVGKYIMYDNEAVDNKYVIEYENIPDDILYDDFFLNPVTNIRNIRWMQRSEILKFSKTK